MATREEIAEGIEEILRQPIRIDFVNRQKFTDIKRGRSERTVQILRYLHSQGVVIKVDKELPKRFLCAGRTSRESYKLGTEDMLVAGYVAVEPIIKE